MDKKKLTILFTVFIDILGLGIIIPILPFYVKSFGVSDLTITFLFSVFSFFAFFSAPLLGSISDRIGRRPVLLISIASTAAGWYIFASATMVWMLFLGRIIDGLAAGNISTAQSYLSDIAKNPKERTTNLGLIGAMFGIGLTIGPFIGGILGNISHSFPFWFVAVLATINCILAYFYIPEVSAQNNRKAIDFNPLKPIINAFSDRALTFGFLAWLLFGLAIAAQQSVLSLYLMKVFGFNELYTGFVLTFMGVILALNQGLFLKRIWLRKFKEPTLEFIMLIVFSIGFFVVAWHNLIIFLVGLFFITISQSIIRVVMTSQMAGVSEERRGEILGMMNSVMSVSLIIGPIMAGYLLGIYSSAPFIASGLLGLLALAAIYCGRDKLCRQQKLPEDIPTNFQV